MLNYGINPDMVMETLEEQVTAIEALRICSTGIRNRMTVNKVESQELFNALLSKNTHVIFNNDVVIYVYKNVTKEQLAVVCDYFQTEVFFNGWKLELLYIEMAEGKDEEYWFDMGVSKDGVSMAASYRNNKLVLTKIK